MPSPEGGYTVPAPWQSGLSNGAVVGEILGLMAAGIIADKKGYKFTIGMALIMVVSFENSTQNECLLLTTRKDMLHFHHLFCRQHRDAAGWRDSLRSPLGSLSNHHYCICRRSYSCGASAIPLHLCQPLLGLWPTSWCVCINSNPSKDSFN